MKAPFTKSIMDKFRIQRKFFTIVAVLVLLSVLSLIAIIPGILQDTSPGSTPKEGAIGTLVVMGIHLLILFGFLHGIRLTKRRRHINKAINIASTIVLFFLGLIIMDGAFAFLDHLLFVSIVMFLGFFCDFAATLVSVAALFVLRSKKRN